MKGKKLILDALFPYQCICGKWNCLICEKCLNNIQKNKAQLCPKCKKLSANGKTCPTCRQKSSLTGVMILSDHEGVLKDVIWQYKYNLIKELHQPLANLLLARFGEFVKDKKFLITAVPLSRSRYRWRGFNQSEMMAKNLSNELKLNYSNTLMRTGKSKPQVGLNRKERIINLKDKFIIQKSLETGMLLNKKILIVDDVYTTGSTLEECAKVLRKNGAKEVWGLVLSRD